MRYAIQLPPKASLSLAQWPPIAVSRDGALVAFVGASEGGTQLFLKRRDEPDVHAIDGTDGAANPAFSPDGRWLLFTAGRDLKKMMIGSGPTAIASIETSRGATWLDDGSIVYGPDASAGLLLLPADGGPPRALTTLDTKKGERSHRWPVALPGGKAVLFVVGLNSSPDDYNNSDVDAVLVATGERRHVLTGASFVGYVDSGHLIFMRNGAIHAVRFDAATLAVTGLRRRSWMVSLATSQPGPPRSRAQTTARSCTRPGIGNERQSTPSWLGRQERPVRTGGSAARVL